MNHDCGGDESRHGRVSAWLNHVLVMTVGVMEGLALVESCPDCDDRRYGRVSAWLNHVCDYDDRHHGRVSAWLNHVCDYDDRHHGRVSAWLNHVLVVTIGVLEG